jgi:hypothetical protein
LVAGTGWDENLGLDAGDRDVRGRGDTQGQNAFGLQEDVGVEAGTLVASSHHVDDAVEGHVAAAGDFRDDRDDVVELEVGIVRDADPEVEWMRVVPAENAADLIHALAPSLSK